MMESTNLTCPKCNLADQIQKVSAIVSHGTRKVTGTSMTSGIADISGNQKHYSYLRKENDPIEKHHYAGNSTLQGQAHSYSTTTVNALDQTDLAKKLSFLPQPIPPQEPQISIWDKFDILKISFMLVVGITFGGITLAIVWNTNVFRSIIDIAESVFPVIGFLVGAVIVNQVMKWVRTIIPFESPESKKRSQFLKEQSAFESEYNNWEKGSKNWNKLYYCFRDDLVFMPETLNIAAPDETIEFCLQN